MQKKCTMNVQICSFSHIFLLLGMRDQLKGCVEKSPILYVTLDLMSNSPLLYKLK